MEKSKLRKMLVGDFTVRRLVGSLVFIYLAILFFAYFFADRIIFIGKESSYSDSDEIIKISTDDGTKLSALYLESPKSEFTILYSHGNAEDIGDLRAIFETFRTYRYSVFAWDYRGYGTSEGRASEGTLYSDVRAVYRYLVNELNTQPAKIILLGRSLGGAAAIDLAGSEEVAGVIAECPFTSAFRTVSIMRLMPFDKFENIDKIDKVRCPILIMHGRNDTVVPFSHGEALFAKANEPKLNLWVDDAGHNDLFAVADVKYWAAVNKLQQMIIDGRKDTGNTSDENR
jgi:fermentation-respiration switch protein FrsA (DUF1100 family)